MKFQKKILIGFAALSAMGLAACSDTTSIKVDTDGGTTIDAIEVKDVKSLIDKLVAPTKAGHTFDGWYIDKDFKDKLDLTDKLSDIKTVYAKWIVGYKITFDTNGGTALAEMTAKDAATLITALKDKTITKANNTFAGWYTDFGLETALTETTEIKAAMTLYAKWTVNEFTVTFVTNGGTEVAPMSVKYDTVVPVGTAVTTKDGMDFAGWYTTEGLTGDAFVVGTTKVTAATTLYAKWTEKEKAQIGTADQLVEYLSGDLSVDAVLTADIDMTGKTLAHAIDPSDETKTLVFTKKLDGAGFTISNLTTSKGFFGKMANGAKVENIKFKDVVFTSAKDNDSLIANEINAGQDATISNITIEGLTFTAAKYAGVLVGKVNGNLTLNKIAVVGSSAQDGYAQVSAQNYSGGIVGQLQNPNSSVTANDVMYAADIVGGASSQGIGGLIAAVNKSCTETSSVTVNGYVFAGSLIADKNVGAVIGDFNGAGVDKYPTGSFKNMLIYSDVSVLGTNVTFSSIFGQLKATDVTYENCKVLDKSTQTNLPTAEGISVIAAEAATAPTEAFEIGTDLAVTLNGVEVALPKTAAAQELAKGEVSLDGVGQDVATDVTYTGEVKWVPSVISGATAGNALKIAVKKDASIENTEFNSCVVTYNDGTDDIQETVDLLDGAFTYYLPVNENIEGKVITITIKWNDACVEQVYTVTIGTVTYEVEPAYATVALPADSELTGSVDAEDTTKVNITAGTIEWDAEAKENYITIEASKPAWFTGETVLAVNNATLVSYSDGKAVIKVATPLKGDNPFSITWAENTDPQNFVVNIAAEVVINKVLVDVDYNLNAIFVEKEITGTLASNVVYNNRLTLLAEGKVDYRKDGTDKLTAFNTGGSAPSRGVKFLVDDEATVTIAFGSGGSDSRNVQFYNVKTGAVVTPEGAEGNVSTSDQNNPQSNSYTLPAGEYIISGVKDTDGKSGGLRIFSINVDYKANNA